MKNSRPEIYFYVPRQELLGSAPADINGYWEWINNAIQRTPAKLGNGSGYCNWLGPYNWTIQTYLYLRASGFACELSASLPDEGIVVTHSDFLPSHIRPLARRFVVEIKPDRSLQCIFANFVIVQNRRDPIHNWAGHLLIRSAFVRYWPQPNLIPRNSNRGTRFENIGYMGNPEQFLQDVDALSSEVKKLGLNWRMMPREKWHDYSDVDAVVAVRPNYSTRLPEKNLSAFFSPKRKPASKLCNAWLAGVPAILSPDFAFQDIRTSDLDYLEASSIPEIVNRLRQLMASPFLRVAMADNGRKRADEFRPEKIVESWTRIFHEKIIPQYCLWTRSVIRRDCLISLRRLVLGRHHAQVAE